MRGGCWQSNPETSWPPEVEKIRKKKELGRSLRSRPAGDSKKITPGAQRKPTDNGNTFIAKLWKDIQAALGIEVTFTPPYHPSSLGGLERQHKDLKLGLKTTLQSLSDELKDTVSDFGDKWMGRLPWVLLGRRTTYQPALDATPAELVLGANPSIPGDIIKEPGPPLAPGQVKQLLEGLRQNAARPPVQTVHNRKAPVNYPDLSKATHVYVRRGKTTLLGPTFDGPFEIIQRLGTSCVKIRVGSFTDSTPREENQHWSNCKVSVENATPQDRTPLGRRPLNPQAVEFQPRTSEATPGKEASPPRPFAVGHTKPLPPPFSQKDGETPQVTRSGRTVRKPQCYRP